MGMVFEERVSTVGGAMQMFGTDTVLAALRLMREEGLSSLPVVDDEDGTFLGQVYRSEVYKLWSSSPLAPLNDVLEARRRMLEKLAAEQSWLH
jgi:CBS domain-containing protein